jgi:hypothetical protein
MRSDLVFEAMERISGRFLLTQARLENNPQTTQTKSRVERHDERCICTL